MVLDDKKMAVDQRRKEELHALKLAGEALKLLHLSNREKVKSAEGETLSQIKTTEAQDMSDLKVEQKMAGPLAEKPGSTSKPKAPAPAPKAAAPLSPADMPRVGGSDSDTVPTMLTPGEAVIPMPAAQNPANKPIIAALVQEGRDKNAAQGLADGSTDVAFDEAALRAQAEARRADWTLRGATNIPTIEELVEQQKLMNPAYADKIARKGGVPEGFVAPPKGIGREGAGIDLTKGINYNVPELEGDGGLQLARFNESGAESRAVPRANPTTRSLAGDPPPRPMVQVPGMAPDKALQQARTEALKDETLAGLSVGEFNAAVQKRANELQAPQSRPGVPAMPKAVPIGPTESISRDPVMEVKVGPTPGGGDEPPSESLAEKQRLLTAALDQKANDPAILSQMNILREEAQAKGDGADQPWLAKRLADIWGPTGLFREDDLGRFALVAAGGMLFGGSPLGSLRYAAMDTMKVADERRGTEGQTTRQKAATAEARKAGQRIDVINRTQAQEDQYKALQATIMDPKLRAQASSMYDAARVAGEKGDWEKKEAYLDQANRILAGTAGDQKLAALVAKAEGKDKNDVTNPDTFYDGAGNRIRGRWREKGVFEREGADPKTGERIFTPYHGQVIDKDRFDKQSKDVNETIDAQLVDVMNTVKRKTGAKDFSDSMLQDKAKAIRSRLVFNLGQEGFNYNSDKDAVGAIVRNTTQSLLESGKRLEDLSPEIIDSVMTSQIIAYSQSKKLDEYFKTVDSNASKKGATKAVSPEAYMAFGDAMKEAKEQDTGNRSDQERYQMLTKVYEGLPAATKERLKEDNRYLTKGWSPFIIWVTNRRKG
jgi:hypothetical protein